MGRRRLDVTIVAVALSAGLPVLASEAWSQPREASRSASAWVDGAEVYAHVCGHCHESGVAPALLGRTLPTVLTTYLVRNGGRAMPSFRAAEIDDAALARLAEYISRN